MSQFLDKEGFDRYSESIANVIKEAITNISLYNIHPSAIFMIHDGDSYPEDVFMRCDGEQGTPDMSQLEEDLYNYGYSVQCIMKIDPTYHSVVPKNAIFIQPINSWCSDMFEYQGPDMTEFGYGNIQCITKVDDIYNNIIPPRTIFMIPEIDPSTGEPCYYPTNMYALCNGEGGTPDLNRFMDSYHVRCIMKRNEIPS